MRSRRPLSVGRPIEERILPEWRGSRLVYLSPADTLRRFGYMFDGIQIDYRAICEQRVSRQDGPVAPERKPFPSPIEAAAFVRSTARDLGADDVGIARVDSRYVYERMDPGHDFVVLLAIDMQFPEFVTAPDARAHREVWRTYDAVGELAVQLAAVLRDRGFEGRAHTVKQEELALIPHAVWAGMGELAKHGSMIHPELGPTFRLAGVTTNLEMAPGEPEAFGVDEFCTRCRLCVEFCPGDAITHDKVMVRDTERWVVDTERCVPYMASHEACGVCLQVCPFNGKSHEGEFKDLFRDAVRRRRPHELKDQLDADMQERWSLVGSGSH